MSFLKNGGIRVKTTYLRVLFTFFILTQFTHTASADLLLNFKNGDAPLSGKVWDTQSRKFVSLETLLMNIKPGSWLLLGETHENKDHHYVQFELIKSLATDNRLGNVALEMANDQQQHLLDQTSAQLQLNPNIEISPEQLEWQAGWPWDWYEAPVSAALKFAKKVVAADITSAEKMKAYRNEDQILAEDTKEYQLFMLDLLFDSHCGKMPKNQLGNMMNVQHARDQGMLEAMKMNTDKEGINILLAGTVHTRYDIGIPYWDQHLDSTTVLMLAAGQSTDLADYYPKSYSDRPVADYLLFTPPIQYQEQSICQ